MTLASATSLLVDLSRLEWARHRHMSHNHKPQTVTDRVRGSHFLMLWRSPLGSGAPSSRLAVFGVLRRICQQSEDWIAKAGTGSVGRGSVLGCR